MLNKGDFTVEGLKHMADARKHLEEATESLALAFDDMHDRDKAVFGFQTLVEPVRSYETQIVQAGFGEERGV